MHPGRHALERPDHPAVIMAGTGETLTYRQLDARSNQLAQLLRAAGLGVGDHVAIFMENRPAYFEVLWAAMRSGLYLTTINRYLTVEEAAYILEDSGSKALITSAAMAERAAPLAAAAPGIPVRLALGSVDGFEDYDVALSMHSSEPLAEQPRGDIMLYSSGTTGRPKGIRRPLSGDTVDAPPPLLSLLQLVFRFDADTVYLSPAPLYHTAPLAYCWVTQVIGGTVVCMAKFDPVDALAAIERYRATHSQWVPTMFVRMLKHPEEERKRFDVSSMQVAIHAAAPCPVAVKQQMLDWWGPIIHEYYGGTEGNGITYASPEDWLAHPGTVGRAIFGTIRICDDEGNELPTGRDGVVYFEQPDVVFEYHNDPDKTRSGQHPQHSTWSTLGDIGHLDDDGFLHLTDRKAFMIISGGVNIYPQEIEDCLVVHPTVADVAVIGVPNAEMGEEVKAVVEPADGVEPSEAVATELLAYCREHLAGYKVPRSVDFIDELPRLPTGKLYKRVLRDRYWPKEPA
ncbi:MAG: acyl-CoA synthetase [Acidimicrobiales bacterium]